MGMYTELALGVRLKKETPQNIIQAINWMTNDSRNFVKPDSTLHLLFNKENRAEWMLRSGGSYYFDSTPVLSWKYDDISETNNLTVWTNIKNYNNEWQDFLNFIAPWVESSEINNFKGFIRYEEDPHPTLIYFIDGKVSYKLPS